MPLKNEKTFSDRGSGFCYLNMDNILHDYRIKLEKETKKKIPLFDSLSTHKAKILAVLQDPGHSGAEKSGTCSIDNNDPTAFKQKEILIKLKIDRKEVLFWNFYASYGLELNNLKLKQKIFWANKLNDLANLMPNLALIISLGNYSWDGFKYFPNDKVTRILFAPHPSRRSMNIQGNEKRLISTWQKVKEYI